MTAPGSARPFVPSDFPVPGELVTAQFRLEPLGPQHNAGDYDAWTTSMGAPGAAGVAVAGGAARVADVSSWVRADRADLDVPLYAAVSAWLADAWPFAEVRYAPRAGAGGGTAGAGA